MKHGKIDITRSRGVLKDILAIIVIFVAFSFVGLKVAAFIIVICTSVLLIRRIIFEYNPGFAMGHHISS